MKRDKGSMDLEHKAIERIKTASEMSLHYYGEPLVCTYSGGKDSDVMLELFERSGIPFEVHRSHTTAAPQTVHHIRQVFRGLELKGIQCNIDYHKQPDGSRITMWNLIQKKTYATYTADKVLLFHPERNRMCKSHDSNRGPLG